MDNNTIVALVLIAMVFTPLLMPRRGTNLRPRWASLLYYADQASSGKMRADAGSEGFYGYSHLIDRWLLDQEYIAFGSERPFIYKNVRKTPKTTLNKYYITRKGWDKVDELIEQGWQRGRFEWH